MQTLGGTLAEQLVVWQESAAGQQWHQRVVAQVARHRQERAAYFAGMPAGPGPRTARELITLAY